MRKIAAGILVTAGLILVLAFAFTLYAQFALDYSLENLKQALELSQKGTPSSLDSYIYRPNLEALVHDEIAQKNADLKTVVLLEHAATAIRGAMERSGYARAGIYLTEVLKEKSGARSGILRVTDAVYRFLRSLVATVQDVWIYLWKRIRPVPEPQPLAGTGVLILGEAERMERSGKLKEAESYYHEFLNRFPDRPERGFVSLSLAHVLTEMRRFGEAEALLKKVRREFAWAREETLAGGLLARIHSIRKREARIKELEAWIKSQPEQIFREEGGGLELALSYLATYQTDRALEVLRKLEESPDPRIRTKALFYRGWIYKWQGDLAKGQEIFQLLDREPGLPAQEKLALATRAELAEIHTEKKEYEEALKEYQGLSGKAAFESFKALAELEQSQIYLFGVGNAEQARRNLQRLQQILPRLGADYPEIKARLEEAFQRGLRDEGFAALAQGRVEVALEIFENYLKKFSRDGKAHSAVGSIYLIRGFLKEALEEAEKGYGLERDEYTASVLGYVYEKQGKFQEAGQYYSIGIQIKPSYLTARFNLAWVYFAMGRYPEADRLLVGLEKEQPAPPPRTRAKILNNRGCALWTLGRKEEATERFLKALAVVPDLVEAKKNLNLLAGEKPVQAVLEIPH